MGGDCLKQLFLKMNDEKKHKILHNVHPNITVISDLVCRIDNDNYLKLKNKITEKCKAHNLNIFFSRDFEKSDHGDIDVFYCDKNVNILEIIKQMFNPIVIGKNSDVITFPYKLSVNQYYQIDFIFVEHLNMANFFYSFGDIGMTIGMMTSHYNLKFGFSGLYIKLTDEILNTLSSSSVWHNTENVFLSNDPVKICEFLGLDHCVWEYGFDKMEHSYHWITTSRFFNPSFFIFGEQKLGKHDKPKRKYMTGFEEYVKLTKDTYQNCDIKYNLDFCMNTLEFFSQTHDVLTLINDKTQKEIKRKTRNEKFSGKDVVKIGYKGKDVNNMIMKFRKYVVENKTKNLSTFEDWLDENNKSQIMTVFSSFCNAPK